MREVKVFVEYRSREQNGSDAQFEELTCAAAAGTGDKSYDKSVLYQSSSYEEQTHLDCWDMPAFIATAPAAPRCKLNIAANNV